MKVFEPISARRRRPIVAGQHVLDADYFRRIDALNFTMAHDDGRLPRISTTADIIMLGISRTSKTPTSIYLAQRGYKTANLPLVPRIATAGRADRAAYGRSSSASSPAPSGSPRFAATACGCCPTAISTTTWTATQIAKRSTYSRRLCARHGWPVIDVTRRSVEETAATIIRLLHDRRRRPASRGGC